jgi:hypothetical protein
VPDEATNPTPPDAAEPDWGAALAELKCNLLAALDTIETLRQRLDPAPSPRLAVLPRAEAVAPAQPAAPAEPTPEPAIETTLAPVAAEAAGDPHSPFERLWERFEQDRMVQGKAPVEADQRRGLDLLPHQYFLTVEDGEGSADLVALHGALQDVAGIEELSLVGFTNGVPVVSLRADRELDIDKLGELIGASMDRRCEMTPQENGKIYARLRPLDEQEA